MTYLYLACRGTCTTVVPALVTTAVRAKSGQTAWRVSRAAVLRSTLEHCARLPSPPALPTPAKITGPVPWLMDKVGVWIKCPILIYLPPTSSLLFTKNLF